MRLFAFFAAAFTILTCTTPSLAHVEKFPPGTRTALRGIGSTPGTGATAVSRPYAARSHAARTGVMPGKLPRGDYGGAPARPVKDWLRESIILARLAKGKK